MKLIERQKEKRKKKNWTAEFYRWTSYFRLILWYFNVIRSSLIHITKIKRKK